MPTSSAPPPATPVRVGDRYALLGELGRGGMATVHRARDEVLGREVAVKLLHAHLARDPAFLDRFRREAQAAAALTHPNVVTVHDWGQTDQGPYLVLQLVAGPSLRAVLRRRGRLLPAEAIAVLTPAAVGIGAAHTAGLVHRDVKPENLLLGLDGTVRVTDFGLARAAASATSTFGTNVLVGSPHYLSPEAVRGEPLDPRADVYALGVVLYEVLVGRPPFEADTPFATAVQHTTGRIPPPSARVDGIPATLDAVVLRATEPDREARYPDAQAFAAALDEALVDEGATVTGLLVGGAGDGVEGPDADGAGGVNGTVVLPAAEHDTTISARAAAVPPLPLGGPPVPPPGGPPPPPVGAGKATLATDGHRLAGFGDPGGLTPDDGYDVDDPDDDEAYASDDPYDGQDDEDDRVGAFGPAGTGTHRLRRVLVGMLVVAALLATSAYGGYLLWDRVLAPIRNIPPVGGAPQAQAAAALEDAGFTVHVAGTPYSIDVAEGHVIDAAPDGQARRGATITLVVSAGPRPVRVADVRGETTDAATATLTASGVRVRPVEQHHPSVAEGHVIGTDPPSGSTVDEASPVDLLVSLGPEPVGVPDVRGQTLTEAQAQLRGVGLDSRVVGREHSSSVPAGSVVAQDPGEGTELLPGDVVELTVSDGPAPVEVPALRNLHRDEAIAALRDLGFRFEVIERGGIGALVTPGRVYEQDPAAESLRPPGTTITIYAYEG